MSRLEAWFHHIANLLVGGTGLVYAWMLYFAEPQEEFSVWNHPWQGDFRDLHIVLAPALVLSFGMLWAVHTRPRIQKGFPKRRRSGISLALSFLPMALSGYFLQVSVEETWRETWKWVHLATSALWMAGYLVHQLHREKRAA